jgi:hypothetical protein
MVNCGVGCNVDGASSGLDQAHKVLLQESNDPGVTENSNIKDTTNSQIKTRKRRLGRPAGDNRLRDIKRILRLGEFSDSADNSLQQASGSSQDTFKLDLDSSENDGKSLVYICNK